MISRRAMLASPLALMAVRGPAAGKMASRCTSRPPAPVIRNARRLARAGIKNVELTAASVDAFLKTDSLPAARRLRRPR
jgi:hypothetical protein